MDDQRIIELYFARDEQAIAETQARYGKLCHHIAQNITGDRQDAEECVNDTYLGLWNSIPPTRPQHLIAYISGIVRNLALKRVEAASRQKRSASVCVSLDELADILPDESTEGYSDDGIGESISAFLQGEKPEARRVFLRKYYFFDSIADIAARYGYSESKVKNMLARTRQKLKEHLTKEGILS